MYDGTQRFQEVHNWTEDHRRVYHRESEVRLLLLDKIPRSLFCNLFAAQVAK